MLSYQPPRQEGGSPTVTRWDAPAGCTDLAVGDVRGLMAVVCSSQVYILDTAGGQGGAVCVDTSMLVWH